MAIIDVDFFEVDRQAHQLGLSHGRDAWKYAHRWANNASEEGKLEEAAFWQAVEAALKPC